MNSIWMSLLWKEWCEQRWKMAALTAILFVTPIAIMLIIYLSGGGRQNYLEGMIILPITILFPFVVLAGLFVGMSAAGGENSRRTMRFLQAMPVPTWQVALVKLLAAFFTVAIPILIVMGAVWAIAGVIDPEGQLSSNIVQEVPPISHPWGISNWYAARMLASIFAACSLLLWTAACGANRSDEIRAGAVGFLIIATAWGLWMYAMYLTERYTFTSIWSVVNVLRAALPGGLATTGFGTARPGLEMIVAGIAHSALLVWFLRRYGKVAATQHMGGGLQISDFFHFKSGKIPRQTPLVAIVWKQFRETGPLALVAVVTIIAIVLLFLLADRKVRSFDEVSKLLAGLGMGIGVFVALVAGIAVLFEDYSLGVNNFWRSQPINVHLWFVVKYLTGLFVLVISFGSILILANWLSGWSLGSRKDAGMVALYFFGCYTLALCAFTLVRQPLYAVVMAMVTPFVAAMCYTFVAYQFALRNTASNQVMAILFGLVLAVLLAWQAVVRDWGWKQSR